MAAHRYWRVVFKQNTWNTYIWLDEVSFRSAADVDLSVGGAAMSGGDYSSSYPASAAFDKTTANSGWASAASSWPAWIGYDHVTPVDVASVVIICADDASASDELPSDDYGVNVEWSDNGTTWTRWNGFTSVKLASGQWAVGQTVRLVPWSGTVAARIISGIARQYGSQMPQRPYRRRMVGNAWRWETQTTGSGTISGIVTIENIPGSRKVRLYRKHDGMLLRETWSAPNGAYSFSNLDPTWEYFVVAHDHLRVYNGVIQDMIQP